MKINKNQKVLLDRITHDHYCFDRRDNTFILSQVAIAKHLKTTRDAIGRLIRTLTKQDLIREIVNNDGKPYLMLSLEVYSKMPVFERHFNTIMCSLRCYDEAASFTTLERSIGYFIDPDTGEQLTKMSASWYKSFHHYIEDYSQDRAGYSMKSRRVERTRNNDCKVKHISTRHIPLYLEGMDIQSLGNVQSFPT